LAFTFQHQRQPAPFNNLLGIFIWLEIYWFVPSKNFLGFFFSTFWDSTFPFRLLPILYSFVQFLLGSLAVFLSTFSNAGHCLPKTLGERNKMLSSISLLIFKCLLWRLCGDWRRESVSQVRCWRCCRAIVWPRLAHATETHTQVQTKSKTTGRQNAFLFYFILFYFFGGIRSCAISPPAAWEGGDDGPPFLRNIFPF
jgi:hypothetical protein